MDAAAQSGVSPYVLAAMILQEQGTNGGTPLISGNYSGYSGYYNFFNVEAYQSGSMSATRWDCGMQVSPAVMEDHGIQ